MPANFAKLLQAIGRWVGEDVLFTWAGSCERVPLVYQLAQFSEKPVAWAMTYDRMCPFRTDLLQKTGLLCKKSILDANTLGSSGIKLKMEACRALDITDHRSRYWLLFVWMLMLTTFLIEL